MTQQRWESVRALREVPMDVWFEYYQENGGVLQRDQFDRLFPEMLKAGMIRTTKGLLVSISLNTAINRLYDYYNKKFE